MKKVLAMVLAGVLALTACFAVAEEAVTPRVGGDLVIAMAYEPDIMNVYSTHLMGDVQAAMVEGLLVPNQQMTYDPVLVKEVPTVENGGIVVNDDGTMVITYHLREDVQWHCGEKFTSKDVKATWEALKNPDWDAESKDGVDDIESIDLPDDYTVVCNYKNVLPGYAGTLFTFGIMPAHEIEGVDLNDPTAKYNADPCGTGPYKFLEWKAGEHLKMVRNENYYGEDGPYLDSITFLFITDENTRINMLKSGEIDLAYGMAFTSYPEIENVPGYNTIVHNMNSWRYLDINQAIPGLDDVNVRRAIECLIDKEGLCEGLFYGIPQPWDQPWMPSDPYHVDGFKSEWSYDEAKAAQILADAGYVKGSDGVLAKDGVRLEFTMICRPGGVDEQIVTILQDYLGSVGIKINIEMYASATFTAMMYAGDYMLAVGGYITDPDASRSHMFANDGLLNRGHWVNDEFTEISHKIDVELNPETRAELVKEALTIFDSEVPHIVLYNTTEICVVSEKLNGFKPNPTNMTNFCQSAGMWLAE